MDDILQQVSDTVTNRPITITVDVKDRTKMDTWLGRNKVKVFQVSQITLGNLIRISRLMREIDINEFKAITKDMILDRNYSLMERHGHCLAKIVATALHNKKDEPSKWLIEFIEANFTASDLFSVLSVVLKQMDVGSFMSTIISIRGLSILENQGASVISANGKEVSL